MISVQNRQRKLRVNLSALQDFADNALRICLETPDRKSGVLKTLRELSVILVSDRRMAELHWRFLKEKGPTDVVTFAHGEIFISVETASENAKRFRTSLVHELQLYLVHGLLHLHGYEDATETKAKAMSRLQEKMRTRAAGIVDDGKRIC